MLPVTPPLTIRHMIYHTVFILIILTIVLRYWPATTASTTQREDGTYDVVPMTTEWPAAAVAVLLDPSAAVSPRTMNPAHRPAVAPARTPAVVKASLPTTAPHRSLKRETQCRRILEEVYGKPFRKVRPAFLRYPKTGRNLELDCYNSEIGLAVEVQGMQHRAFVPFLHQNDPQKFRAQQKRDSWKRTRCKQLGVDLIEVSDTEADVDGYLRAQLRKRLERQTPWP
jgi:hypothetical protein